LAEVARREAAVVGAVAHLAVDLGGEDDLLAPAAALREPAPDDLLSMAEIALLAPLTVAVGRVKEVDAEVERLVHDGEAVRLRGLRTEVHRAQAQRADLQAGASKVDVVHAFSSSCAYAPASTRRSAPAR